MTETPILFRGDMIRAIFADLKGQTRRLAGLDAVNQEPGEWRYVGTVGRGSGDAVRYKFTRAHAGGPDDLFLRCPYKPTTAPSRLWVRETWAGAGDMAGIGDTEPPQCVAYRATETAVIFGADLVARPADVTGWNWQRLRWRPSIFMPKWACRLRLDVLDVRAERIQSITEDDARREGIDILDGALDEAELYAQAKRMGETATDARVWFAVAWRDMHGDAGWDRDPWVWVISFRRAADAAPAAKEAAARC